VPEIIVFEVTDRGAVGGAPVDDEGGMDPFDLGEDCVDLSVELIERVLDEAKPFRPRIIALAGGEPAMHGEFRRLLEAIAGRGMEFTFESGGWEFEELCEGLAETRAHLRGVTFRLDGASPETHDASRGPGSFDLIRDAMARAHGLGIPFGVRTAVNASNAGQLEKIAALADRAGADELGVVLSGPACALTVGEMEGVERRLAELMKRHRRLKIGVAAGGRAPHPLASCGPLSMTVVSIDRHGFLRFCPELTACPSGEREPSDIIADLGAHSLHDGLKALANRISLFTHHKIDRAAAGDLTDLDYHPCRYCLGYFEKAGPGRE